MGKSYTPVLFYTGDIKIDAHSASLADDLGVRTIDEFACGKPVRVSRIDNGELLVESGRANDPSPWDSYKFMEGPEVI